MRDRILVINPNSTVAVTRAIDEVMAPLRIRGGPEIECSTLEEGPPGVESQTDADGVILPLCRLIREQEADTAAFVVACFSDPGLFSARPRFPSRQGCRAVGMLQPLDEGPRLNQIVENSRYSLSQRIPPDWDQRRVFTR